jgi:Cyclic nucleotide-binding domain
VVLPLAPSIRPAVVLEALANAAASSEDVLSEPKPIVSVRRATNDAIEYEIVCYVDTLGKKTDVRNDLFDLAYRHLLSRGVVLRPLSVPEPAIAGSDEKHRLLRNVMIFQTLEDDAIAELEAKLTKHEFDPGETIYAAADESGHTLHIMAQGVAKVSVPKNGGEIELRRLAPGDSIGQSGILAGVRTNVIMRSMTHATVYRLDKAALTPILVRRPDVAKEMCRLLSEHHATEQMMLASPADADQTPGGLLQWIRDGVRRFHELTF